MPKIESLSATTSHANAPSQALRSLVHIGSACAFSGAVALCATIYAHFGGTAIIGPDGTIRIYKVAAFILICFAGILGSFHYLSNVSERLRYFVAVLASASAVGMFVFVETASATTFSQLYPGILMLGALAIITGALVRPPKTDRMK